MELGRRLVRLEGNDFEARNHLEVTHIGGSNPVAKLERRDTDQQVGEGHTDALGSILAVDLTGSESHRNRHRMDRQSSHQFIQELPPHGFSLRSIGAGCSMRQFDQRNDRHGDIFARGAHCDFGQSLSGILALAFCRDEYAGVEDQAH